MRTAIVIPVYNHRQRVVEVIRQAVALDLPVFVVDDGSTDGTSAVLAPLAGITVLRHPRNRGKGAALLTGFAAAAAARCDWALTIDGDGQHNPADGLALLAAARRHGRVLVVGRRRGMDGAHVPWTSRFGRGFSNFWVRAAGGPQLADSQSGFRLYPLPETLDLGVRARRYQFEVEVLVQARRHGLATVEVPVQVIYQPRGERVSHFRPWVDFGRNSATFARLIWSRLLRWDRRR